MDDKKDNNVNSVISIQGEQIEARYIEQNLEEYSGNPLIEALPKIFDIKTIFKKIGKFPPYNNKERELPSEMRIHCVSRLTSYVEPLTCHANVEERISMMLRRGYVERNPFSTEFVKKINAISKLNTIESKSKMEKLKVLPKGLSSVVCGFSLIGISGIGKTTTINRILSMYPQVIYHSNYKDRKFMHTQIVWLKLDCPLDGSLKSLCKNFFKSVDDILGSNYYQQYNRLTLDSMVIHMAHIAYLYSIGGLFIDEIQHLTKAKSGADLMLNFFVTLVNTIGIPVAIIGTFKSFAVLQSDFRQARRASGYGEIIWNKMSNDDEWKWFLKRMWNYQWVKKESHLNDEISNIMYEETQGITDRAIKLYMLAQWRAISSGKEEITASFIQKVAKEEMRMTRPMLNALKNNDLRELAKYDDIRPPDIDILYSNVVYDIKLKENIKQLREEQEAIREMKNIKSSEKIILWLIDGGVDPNIATKATNKIINQFGINNEIDLLKKESMKCALSIEQENIDKKEKKCSGKKNNSNKQIVEFEKNDLRNFLNISALENTSMYNILKKELIIKNPLDEFLLG